MTEPHVFRIEVPNPYFESATNVYLIAARPLTLIDTGIGSDAALQALEQGLQEHGCSLDAIEQVILTHKHPDHFGLARTIHERSAARVFIHQDDLADVTRFDEGRADFVHRTVELLRTWGTPQHELDRLPADIGRTAALARSIAAEPLADGQRLPLEAPNGQPGSCDLEVVHTPGHTEGSICLRFGRHLFTGDHLLPNYTPNIGAGAFGAPRMLDRYLASLDRLRAFQTEHPDVLPGHGSRVANLTARIDAIQDHHVARADGILRILSDGRAHTVYEIAKALFRRLRGFHLVLGTAETYAHLELLEDQARLARDDGRYRLP